MAGSTLFADDAVRPRVLVILDRPVVDVYLDVPTIPAPGEKVVATATRVVPGGVCDNFAAAAAHLGCEVVALGSDSDDPLAEYDRASLASFGVRATWSRDHVGGAVVCYVLVDGDGRRSVIVRYPEDLVEVTRSVAGLLDAMPNERFDLAYWGVLNDRNVMLLPRVRPKAMRLAATLEDSDWLSPQLHHLLAEFAWIFIADESYEAHREEIDRAQNAYGFDLLITRGPAGSTLRTATRTLHAPAVDPDRPVVDATGAGDAWAAAFSALTLAAHPAAESLWGAGWFARQAIDGSGSRHYAPADRLLAALAAHHPQQEGTP